MQVIETINASRVPIPPGWLNAIRAHPFHFAQFKRARRERRFRAAMHLSHNISLALAPGAWTGASQLFKRHITFGPILPSDRHFISYHLDIEWLHRRARTITLTTRK